MSALPFQGVAVLVTGGAGFIGSHLVDALVAAGAAVRVLDNLSSGSRQNIAHHLTPERAAIDFLEGDICDAETCRQACQGVELVFHQAALGSVPRSIQDPATSIAVNVTGTAQVFDAARQAGARRVVYASSSSVYGDSQQLPKREGEEGAPLSPYAASKCMNETLAAVFGRCYPLQLVGLRYFNVYGPRQSPQGPYAAVLPRFFAACLGDEAPRIYGDGEQSRDFTYVADAVNANLLAATAPDAACATAYNVAGGQRASVNELAVWVREAAGSGLPPQHEAPRPGDVRHSWADLSRTEAALGYTPAWKLRDGLARTLDAFRDSEASQAPVR